MTDQPIVALIGGPNGAGKTTISRQVMLALNVERFINADEIAAGMSDDPQSVAIEAGRQMLKELKAARKDQESFVFESTLASRGFARFVEECKRDGFWFHLTYIWVPDVDLSLKRVALRVAAGGHLVPDDDIRRRHERSIRNFFELYMPLADEWDVLTNLDSSPFRSLAHGSGLDVHWVGDDAQWSRMRKAGGHDD